MYSFRRWREKYGRVTLYSLWDLFMVWVVMINLCLILFDLSYLWARPFYVRHARFITKIWDPVLGIKPHPVTVRISEDAAAAEEILGIDPTSPALEERLQDLQKLTLRMFDEDAFARSGQTRDLVSIWVQMGRETGHVSTDYSSPEIAAEVATDFWSGSPETLAERFEIFDQHIEPLLELNYYRGFDLDGELIDHFWKIDLPFLILFWIEFMTRWILTIRKRTYTRWYFFPIFYWYDLLSLIPVTALRPLRLLRVLSIYMRLRQSDISNIGRDIVSRTVAYFSNIITEEVSDRVAVRILDEYREEISDGTHVRIFRSTFEPRKEQIEKVLVDQIRGVVTDEDTVERFRQLLELNLQNAVEESESLRSLPLPHVVVKPVVRAVGEVLLDTTLETIATTLDTPEGEEAVQAVAASIIDSISSGPALAELESLAKDITLQIIDQMKDVVEVKKWALPKDQQDRPVMPWEESPED